MRPIDADALIEKEERSELDRYIDGERCYQMVVPSWAIIEAPTIDAVSVVRCRECIHYGRDSERNTYGCNLHSIGMTPSDFCSYGEREGE